MATEIKFKAGDYVFYKSKDGGMIPTKVWAVTKKRVVIENWRKGEDEFGKPHNACAYVSPNKLILQTEWKEQNQ